MTVNQLADLLNAKIAHLADGEREVTTGYCGDFLSFVMGKAPADSAWFTVMSNLNVCAVASLTDCATVVICEGVVPDDALVQRAVQQDINVLMTDLDIYHAATLTATSL